MRIQPGPAFGPTRNVGTGMLLQPGFRLTMKFFTTHSCTHPLAHDMLSFQSPSWLKSMRMLRYAVCATLEQLQAGMTQPTLPGRQTWNVGGTVSAASSSP